METRVGKCLCGEPERVETEGDRQVLVRCPHYIKLMGKDPQTGDPIDEWRCTMDWVPILMVEGIQRMNEMGAAIESLRNELCRRMDAQALSFKADNALARLTVRDQGTEGGKIVEVELAPTED